MKNIAAQLKKQTDHLNVDQFIKFIFDHFSDKIALASSMGAEDQVLTDIICKNVSSPNIFTLDTGRLPGQTYSTIEKTNQRYGIKIKILFPPTDDVEQMVNSQGPNLFYDSIEARKKCCYVRKVIPLQRQLQTLGAWITGLRRDQAVTRGDIERVEFDQSNNMIKINPLANWTVEDVWQYISDNNVPYNPLHDQGYPSLGCAPCTRAIKNGQDIRDGRWWWENPEHKECGLHHK